VNGQLAHPSLGKGVELAGGGAEVPWFAAVRIRLAHLMERHMRSIAIGLLLGTLAVAACSDHDNLVVTPSIQNRVFTLQTVNGAALPAVVFDSANPPLRLDALFGAITINPNNLFSDVTTLQQTLSGVVSTRTVTCTGTYSQVGNVFEFVEAGIGPDCGLTFSGVLSGTALAASVLGVPAVFSQ
jgi:hypothetical protein